MRKYIVGLSIILSLSSNISAAAVASSTSTIHQQWQGAIVYSGLFSVGSGVPVSNCHILTNEHVVRGKKSAFAYIEGEQHDGEVVSLNKENDIALIKLDDCPIKNFAKVATVAPKKGEILTSVYAKSGFNFFHRSSTSKGVFKGFSKILTEEDRTVASMVIDDTHPRLGASGGGVMSKNGLVSVIFSIASPFAKPETYAVDYFALRDFVKENVPVNKSQSSKVLKAR